jgi:XTP/dITP diphosphohydrolase
LVLRELGLTIDRVNSKGSELQSDDLGEIAKFAATEASKSEGRALAVEDTGLFIASLNGFPGPYANFTHRKLGLDVILRILEYSRDRSAIFESAVAYCEPGGIPHLFRGSLRGRIGTRASGSNGFGFDPVFIPAGEDVTLAQMTLERKCSMSHRAIAVRRFGKWYWRWVLGQPL